MRTRPRTTLAVVGGALFLVSYAPVAAVGLTTGPCARCDSRNLSLTIPFAGPFVRMASWGIAERVLVGVPVVLDAAIQLVGAGLAVGGLASKEHVLVRGDLATSRVVPVPTSIGRSGAGVGLVGTF